jgi:hypothetical protein
MKLSIALAGALAATAMAAPYSRCKLNGKVVDCNKMAEGKSFFKQRVLFPWLRKLPKILGRAQSPQKIKLN